MRTVSLYGCVFGVVLAGLIGCNDENTPLNTTSYDGESSDSKSESPDSGVKVTMSDEQRLVLSVEERLRKGG